MTPRWFQRREVGLGWRPATRQGWLITALTVAGVVAANAVAPDSTVRLAASVAIVAVYLVLGLVLGGAQRGNPSSGRAPRSAGAPAESQILVGVSRSGPAVVTPRAAGEPAASIPSLDTRGGGPPALAVHGLGKRYGDRAALQDVSFEVGSGEVFGFLGPNGAGKTTTVRILGTLIAPTSGSAEVAGLPLTPANGVDIRQRIAIMPESPGLYGRLTVAENLQFFAGLYGLHHPAARIHDALEAVNLGPRAQDPCGSLSKGLRQRVGLARALLNDPVVLFLDEPTSGLDPVAAREVHDLILGLRQRGVTIFLTTHRLEEAERLCDRVAILNTTLRTVGRPDELRSRLFHSSLAVRTVSPLDTPDRLFAQVPGVDGWHLDGDQGYIVSVSDPHLVAPALTRALVAAGADVLSISESQHSLEDVYFQLIGSNDAEGAAQ